MTQEDLLFLLHSEIKPAVGCTEPAAVALASATAAKLINAEIIELKVIVNPNIYKNGMGVYVPGTNRKGLDFAAALGAIGGNPDLELEVLRDVTPEEIEKANKFVESGRVNVSYIPDYIGVYVETNAKSRRDESKVIIKDMHSNVVYKELNGNVIYDVRRSSWKTEEAIMTIQNITIENLIDRVNQFRIEDLRFLEETIVMNTKIAKQGISAKMGLGVGAVLNRLIENKILSRDITNVAKAYTAGATDARMSGKNLPVMSCGGSGNQGLMASLPVIVAADLIKTERGKLYRALALSFLVTIYVKTHIGRLSALCGCAIAASAGAGAGIGYLMGLKKREILGVIQNLIGDITGMICDGAKPGCSLKLITAVDAAVQMVFLAKEGVTVDSGSGIVCGRPEESIKNVGLVSKPGMVETDRTILNIMLQGCSQH